MKKAIFTGIVSLVLAFISTMAFAEISVMYSNIDISSGNFNGKIYSCAYTPASKVGKTKAQSQVGLFNSAEPSAVILLSFTGDDILAGQAYCGAVGKDTSLMMGIENGTPRVLSFVVIDTTSTNKALDLPTLK